MRYILALLVLGGVQLTAWAAPSHAAPAALKGAAAVILQIEPGNALQLRVSGLRSAADFELSPNCIYTGGLRGNDDLHPGLRVLVWTQSGGAGKLPLIIKMARMKT